MDLVRMSCFLVMKISKLTAKLSHYKTGKRQYSLPGENMEFNKDLYNI